MLPSDVTPCDRAAPVVADNRERIDAERIGQQEDADDLVRAVILDLRRLRGLAIAALIGRDAPDAK